MTRGGRRRLVVLTVAAAFGMLMAGIPAGAFASTQVVLSQTVISFSYYSGAGAGILGYATVYQDTSTRNLQVTLTRDPGQSYTATGYGASGASCGASLGTSPIGVLIVKVLTAAGQTNLAANPTMTYLSGSSNWAGQSDYYTGGSEYVQACFAGAGSSQSTQIDISATWASVAYDSGIYLSVVAGNPYTNALQGQTWHLLATTGGLQGTVTGPMGVTLPGPATVTLSNAARTYSTVTSSTGAYSISPVVPDTYTATAVGPCNYYTYSTTVTVPSGPATNLGIALQQYALAALDGYVYGGSTSNPLSGAVVKDTCGGYSGTTTSTGQYNTWITGDKTITVTATGPCKYQGASTQVDVLDGTTQVVNFVLPAWPLGTLWGYVYDATIGGPVAGATIKDACSGATATTDGNGYYSFLVVSGKSITVSASASGYNGQSTSIAVPSGGSASLSFYLTEHVPGGGGCKTPPCPTSPTLTAASTGIQPSSWDTTTGFWSSADLASPTYLDSGLPGVSSAAFMAPDRPEAA